MSDNTPTLEQLAERLDALVGIVERLLGDDAEWEEADLRKARGYG